MASTPIITPEEEGGREPAAMSVRGAAVWAMGGQYLSFGMQFITSVIISRFFLTPAEVGLFSIGLAAAMLASVLQDFGLSRYISGLPSLDAAEISRCSSVALLFSFVVAGIIAAAAWPIAATYGQPALFKIMLIIAASYLFVPLAVVPMALLGRTMSFHSHFVINVGAAAAQGIHASDAADALAIGPGLSRDPATGTFCHGEAVTLADVCLVPQMANARRMAIDLAPYPTLLRIDAAARALPPFAAAASARNAARASPRLNASSCAN